MSDELKFYNMTKPIGFRRMRQLKMSAVLWCKAQRERIKYLSNYLLYKFNILDRYSYRDNVEKVIPIPHTIKIRHINTPNVRCSVSAKLIEEESFDIDYFFRMAKTGEKKITYSVKNNSSKSYSIVFSPHNIIIRVGQTWFDVSRLPVFKATVVENPEEPNNDYKTVTVNTKRLTTLQTRYFLGKDLVVPEDLPSSVIEYYCEVACRDLERHLKGITLQDLMM